MQKPTFPVTKRYSATEIMEVRSFYRMTRPEFARFFDYEWETIKSWETGKNKISGPAAIIFCDLKAYADHVKAEKEAILEKILSRSHAK